MNKQRLAAMAAVAGLLFGCASAHATPIKSPSVDVTFTISTSNGYGNPPKISDDQHGGFTYTEKKGWASGISLPPRLPELAAADA